MKLNLPIFDHLKDSRSILIAGAGGGFDVYAGLPLYFALREAMPQAAIHLASYSFVELEVAEAVSETERLSEHLIGARGRVHFDQEYLPEPYLAQWFEEVHGEQVTVWMFDYVGARPLTEAYRTLVEHLKVDAVIMVDGGVDSVMRGDEKGGGTMVEDTLSLIAVNALEHIPVKLLACLGFGTEVEEQVCHYSALENMADLIKVGGFRGACALTPQMDAFQQYAAACRYVWSRPNHQQSHISTRIIPAVEGEFGNHHMSDYYRTRAEIFLSPLMSLYWFFDAAVVFEQNLLAESLLDTETRSDAMMRSLFRLRRKDLRPMRRIPY
jgi:hypothetical protein